MKPDLFTQEIIYPTLRQGPLIDQVPSPLQKVLALSWKQPFCSLMLPPFNKIETRTWQTKYRGYVLMCATLTSYKFHQLFNIAGNWQLSRIDDALEERWESIRKYRGYAIGIGRLADCRPMTSQDEDACYVRFESGLYCHIYTDVHPITPIRWKGKLGWSQLTVDQIKLIEIEPL